jgi:hypothetical protein
MSSQTLYRIDGAIGYACLTQALREFLAGQPSEDIFYHLIQSRTIITPRGIISKTRGRCQISITQYLVTKACPLTLILYRNHHLFAAKTGVCAIGCNRGMIKTHPLGRLSPFLMQ